MSTYLLSIATLPIKAFRRLYNWTMNWSKSQKAPYALFILAFCESSFFPIPPDVLLIPMVAANIKRWWRNALICTLGSVIGAFLGYLIGYVFYESIGKPIVDFYNLQEQVQVIGQKYADNAFWTIFIAAFTPIPYKLITIAAGLFGLPIYVLVVASAIGRGARFFIVSGLIRIFGTRIVNFIEKYFDWLSIAFVVLLVGGFLAIKYLF